MPATTRAGSKLKKLEVCDCDKVKLDLSDEKARRVATETQMKTMSLENERKLSILHSELELERQWRINTQESFELLLQKIPSHSEQKKSTTNVVENISETDPIGEGRGGQRAYETHVPSLDKKTKIEILHKELEIERSWRTTCQENLNSLIKRLPLSSTEKSSTTNEAHIPPARNMRDEDGINRSDEMNKNALDLSDFNDEAAKKEIERLTHLCSTLSEKNEILKSAHNSELAVCQDFRIWVESQTFCPSMRFKEFQSEDIEELIKDHQEIGSGGFGKVYKAVIGNTAVAVKVLSDNASQDFREYHTEVEILRKIHHPNLVHLIGACTDKMALIYEYLENGTLENLLKDKKASWFTWKERINVALSICSALIFLHSIRPMPVVHGDLKPENIMFNALNVPKIGDFGISHELNYTTNTGTWEHLTRGMPRGSSSYVDPEFQNTCKLTPFADVYAFGVILLQLVTGQDAMGLANLVQQKLSASPNLKYKGEKIQKKILEKLSLIDRNLTDLKMDTYDPRAIFLELQLGLDCTKTRSCERPTLSAGVWPKLYMIKQKCENSSAVQ